MFTIMNSLGTKILSLLLSVALSVWLVPMAWADTPLDTEDTQRAEEAQDAVFDQENQDGELAPGNADGSDHENDGDLAEEDVVEEGGQDQGQGDDVGDRDSDGAQKDEAEDQPDESQFSGALVVDKDESSSVMEGATEESYSSDVADAAVASSIKTIGVSYSAHVQGIGWQGSVKDSATAGTTGKALRVEALRLSLTDKSYGSIRYSAYVEGSGWMSEVKDGATMGTTGESRQLEALQISLVGEVAQHYDVYYRVHASGFGWLGWTSNGQKAGSVGYSYQMEAVQVSLVQKGASAPSPIGNAFKTPGNIAYSTHVSAIGWQGAVADGKTAGTTGKSLAVEALQVNVPEAGYTGEVVYSSHVSGIGWMRDVRNGGLSGTVGRALQMEAFKVSLTGELAQRYDVYYRAHVQGYGWLDWAANGAVAGTTGLGFRLEAVSILLVAKGSSAPGGTARPSVSAVSAQYSAHVQKIGWQSWAKSGSVAGTTGRSLAVEALQMKLNSNIAGGITYRLHVQGQGWQNWVSDGATAGTTGRSLRAEAVSIKLTGEAARYYDVYYRVHAEGYGWLGWASNGANAGTSSCGYRMEALQVVIVGKGAPAPGSTSGAYKTTPLIPAWQQAMNSRANGTTSTTGWLLMVDTSNCVVGVYSGSRGHWTNTALWSCAVGNPWTPTVTGQFSVGLKGYSFGSGYTCYYWTQFFGDYLFHSVLYYQGTHTLMDGTLGRPASHGCVRLPIEQAKWIYDVIPSRTTVIVY